MRTLFLIVSAADAGLATIQFMAGDTKWGVLFTIFSALLMIGFLTTEEERS